MKVILQVSMTGEVFFDVAEDTLHPLYVTARGRRFEATGTTFNMNAYEDSDSVYTTLINGHLIAVNRDNFQIMQPGEQMIAAAQEINKEDTTFRITHGDIAQLK